MKKLKFLKYIWVLGGFLTVSCQKTENPNNENIVDPNQNQEQNETKMATIECLKDGLEFIRKNKNFTLSYKSSTLGTVSYTFEEKAIGRNATLSSNALSAYIEDEFGVYHLGYDNKYVAGEYLVDSNGERIKSVWDKNITPNLYGLGENLFKTLSENSENYSFKDKEYKMSFIKSVGLTEEDYVNVNYLTASFVDGRVVFILNIEGEATSRFYYLEKPGKTVNEDVKDFLASDLGAFSPDENLSELRRLMRTNNFIRQMYNITKGTYDGMELFNEHYFYTEQYGSNAGSGCVSFHQAANEDHSVDLKGCYYFTTAGSYKDGLTKISLMSQPYNDNPDITKVYHYPTFLKVLDSLEYFKEGSAEETSYTPKGECYHVTNNSLLVDFINNFSLNLAYDPAEFVPLNFEVDIRKGTSDSSTTITFVYNFLYGNTVYSDIMPFSSFGNAKISLLDNVYNTYND